MSSVRHDVKTLVNWAGVQSQLPNPVTELEYSAEIKMKPITQTAHSRLRLGGWTAAHCREVRLRTLSPGPDLSEVPSDCTCDLITNGIRAL